jgi:hypothetical protein
VLPRLERLEHRLRVLGVSAPDPPMVEVKALRSSAAGSGYGVLQIEWHSGSTHGSPLTGFELRCTAERTVNYQYASLNTNLLDEMRKWNASRSELEGCTHNVRLKAGVRSHRFSALRCGADYTFDVVALNAQGVSQPGSAFYPHGSCMPLPCRSYRICSVCILVIYCSSADCRIHYDTGLDVNVTERHFVQLWADLRDGTASLRVLSTSRHSSLVRSSCTTWETSGKRQRRLAAAEATCSTTACVR